MGSMGALIAITCIANYISGMILAREKYDFQIIIDYDILTKQVGYWRGKTND